MATAISIKNLYKKYGPRYVLEDLSFDVEKGSIYGFLGQNGAGKTTTIKILSGLSIPNGGQILIDNMDLSLEADKIKNILGLVPQDSEFYDERTALSQMNYFARLKGLSKDEGQEQSMLLLERVGLENEMTKKVGSFSHGMKKRLSIAQALLNDPKILILDEPTNGLDPVGVRQVKQIIRDCNDNGITIFASSHNLLEIQEICTHIGILKNGRLITEGTIGDIRRLESNGVITVGIYNMSPEIVSLVEGVEYVVKTELKEKNILEIYVNSKTDVKPELNKLIVNNGGQVFKLIENSLSLEDAYLSATEMKE
ncbi:ABC-2 type transport system ATP-binding protein [Methanolobus vulcani]|uniref:ABC-2 type transport system ATP-binding protein n=1 Tax=Methanolobus vulcani TaxID=38026 RepID=A0A7Z7AYX4_9EURY|nr:ABC transporter ATP-binding protein [Methanolobus vulcani]SDG32202.1 ABC-2 type transport system ATP-binding protein [Methanolobus vulcani]